MICFINLANLKEEWYASITFIIWLAESIVKLVVMESSVEFDYAKLLSGSWLGKFLKSKRKFKTTSLIKTKTA